jgi:hypothetical protein
MIYAPSLTLSLVSAAFCEDDRVARCRRAALALNKSEEDQW